MRTKLLAMGLAISAGILFITGFADRTSAHLNLKTNSNTVSLEDSVRIISQSTRSEAEIWSLLQQGTGYVVLIRHALAPGRGDPSNFQLDDCSTQRNLSDTGRAQAVRIGEAFKSRQIPIARILSSQWCRCLETARLMDAGSVEPLTALNSTFYDPSAETERTDRIRQFVIDHRNIPGTTVMVTHASNISAIAGASVQSGGIVVLRADEEEQINLIGEIEAF
ncbi:MAG: histidine phosphatase family protein [Pleurocapsa sp. MO_226.B13]|nr:histidine phosphatase family protein [Pleurocapsa sp. MO_226.B13]